MKPMDKELLIKGEHIFLRPITAQDTELVLSWRNSPEVVQNFIYRKPITVEEHTSWLENKVFTGQVHQFIICDAEDGMPLGSAYIQNIDEDNHKAEWGLFLGSERTYNRGIGTETAFLIMDYAFDDLGLHKLTSRVLAHNRPCVRMNEKIGYRQEAYLKDELFIDGKYEDLIYYGLVKGEIRR